MTDSSGALGTTLTFFLSSGFPFFTVATNMSPTPAAGRRFRRPRIPWTAITYRFLAPVLSAQFITAPTGKPREMRNLPPAVPPRPG
ncbi:GD25103 [Drosophila simulans]|uniref:GD25103 n=1 Tax=Drosophila simulans TaxID=7240 RepID=B4QI18_DROSI|nr:GD25103 [Drosophila simulans]